MIDFKKLNTPEFKERAKQYREQRENELEQKHKTNKFMIDKLHNMVENGEILSGYDCNFIRSVFSRVCIGLPLTDKQEKYLDEIFHNKY